MRYILMLLGDMGDVLYQLNMVNNLKIFPQIDNAIGVAAM